MRFSFSINVNKWLLSFSGRRLALYKEVDVHAAKHPEIKWRELKAILPRKKRK